MRSVFLRISIIVCLFCCLFDINAGNAETILEATLRSGSVIGEHDIPPVLMSGDNCRFTWMTQSYVPLRSWFQIQLPNGTTNMIEATLGRTEQGNYHINDRYSRNYHFYVDYTIPNTVGRAKIGFYHAQDDAESAFRMYGLFPTGAVDRPYGTAGKQFYRNICTQDSYGGQCVAYVRDYFGNDYNAMPGLCAHNDCGAYHAYDDWDFGFGRGMVPKVNSIIVMDTTNTLPVGHVAVVVGVDDNNDGTFDLTVQESNWGGDENVDCGVTYTFDADTLEVSREGGAWMPLRGFIYSNVH